MDLPAGCGFDCFDSAIVSYRNELLAKIVADNLTVVIHEMYENGINPDFLHPMSDVCT